LISLNLVVLIYEKKELKLPILPGISLKSGTGILGIFAGILSSAFCLSCLAPIFALLGLSISTMLLFIKYRSEILIIAIILLLISFNFSLARVRKCKC